MGCQEPSVRWVPPYVSSLGSDAVELAESCGLVLDPWQKAATVDSLGFNAEGKLAAFEVGVNVPRQNGKGALLEARELASIFLLGDRLVVHSAHEFPTAMQAMDRMENLLLENPELKKQLRKKGGISRSHGDEGFKFADGRRIWYRTRTKGGGRGFTADLVVLDEAMILQEMFIAALMYTMSAKTIEGNPQLWYTGSAVDQLSMEHGVVFSRLRQRGIDGGDPSLAYFEWSAFPPLAEDGTPMTPEHVTREMLKDPAAIARANPGLGKRIALEHVFKEMRSADERTSATERLGVGDYPSISRGSGSMVMLEDWNLLTDPDSSAPGDICLAFDVRPDRAKAVIVACGYRADGRLHLEVIDYRAGTNWVVPRLIELRDKWRPRMILRTSHGPVSALRTQIQDARLDVTEVSATEFGEACGRMVDLVNEDKVRHRGDPEFQTAVRGARTRAMGEALAWSRKMSVGDVSPLVAASIAAWMAEQRLTTVYADRGILTV